jgi:perosamine synthetase
MVTTNDDRLAERLRLLRNLAFTTPRFRHEAAGYNFRMTGFQAAMGLVQFAKIERIIDEKRRVAHAYNRALASVPGLRLPVERDWARNVYWMYGIVVDEAFGIGRDELARRLHDDGIETRTFFCPMNQQPFLRAQEGYRDVACPVADKLWERGLYLPSAIKLTQKEITKIADAIARAAQPKAFRRAG